MTRTRWTTALVLPALVAALGSPARGQKAPCPIGVAACCQSERECDDGDACNGAETCEIEAGTCVGGPPVTCPPATTPCLETACSPATGACEERPRKDDTACDDGDPCTERDQCLTGRCRGEPRSCDDEVPCTADQCAAGGCEHTPVDAHCDRGECVVGACRPDDPEADVEGCVATPAGEGEPCTDDGFACTTDRCSGGRCRHTGADDRCTPSDECGAPACDPEAPDHDAAGCARLPALTNGRGCSEDGDPCTDDVCREGVCTHEAVPQRATCDPVRFAWDQARALAGRARALGATLGDLLAAGTPGLPDGPGLLATLDDVGAALEAAAAALAGRPVIADAAARRVRPATTATASPSQFRAQIAFTRVRSTPAQIRGFLAELATAQVRAGLAPAIRTDLVRRGRDLLRGTISLKRNLRRLMRTRRALARTP